MSLTGDVHADLLTAADEVAEAAYPKAVYKGEVVEVVSKGLALTKIRYPGESDAEAISVPSDKLLPFHAVPATGTYGDFVAMLQRKGYLLYVEIHKEAEKDKVIEEYAEWSGGQQLPEECIRPYTTGESFWREWTLIYQYEPSWAAPFDLVRTGTGGGGKGKERRPVGIIDNKGKVMVRWPVIVEKCVRAGLRAQPK